MAPGSISTLKEFMVMLRPAALVLPLLFVGCGDQAATAAADGRAPAKVPPAQAGLPATAVATDNTRVTGTVVETMDAGPYTYLHLKTSSGEVWAAVNEARLKTGSEVTIGDALWMEKFESKTLKRKFDRVLFGRLIDSGEAAALPPGHPSLAKAEAAAAPIGAAPGVEGDTTGDVKVDKAPGGRTVAEIFAAKATLKGVEVIVRGKVVKFNAEIMGRNWLHLRDGSGSADRQDNDLTVTTKDAAVKGDIVTVRGKLALDKDFTAGYVYPLIVEDARVVK
jgi:hypothetical protein